MVTDKDKDPPSKLDVCRSNTYCRHGPRRAHYLFFFCRREARGGSLGSVLEGVVGAGDE